MGGERGGCTRFLQEVLQGANVYFHELPRTKLPVKTFSWLRALGQRGPGEWQRTATQRPCQSLC